MKPLFALSALAGGLLRASPLCGQPQSLEISTLAGLGGGFGSADGPASQARFRWPTGIAVDGAGNAYVADAGNHTIRRIAPDGVVTTFAGQPGIRGSADGFGSEARFTSPRSVAVDPAGNVYVAEDFNHTIRKITPSGQVTTLAGLAETPGAADGMGSEARFNLPRGLAVDDSGTVYVADQGNATIRKIAPDGTVTTWVGRVGRTGVTDGAGSSALFHSPEGLAVDNAGHVYVGDWGNDNVRKITPAGVVSTLAG